MTSLPTHLIVRLFAVAAVFALDELAVDGRAFMLVVLAVGLGHNAVATQYSMRRIREALSATRSAVTLVGLSLAGVGLWLASVPIAWVFLPHHAASEAWMPKGPQRGALFAFHLLLFAALARVNLRLPATADMPLAVATVATGLVAVLLIRRARPDAPLAERLDQVAEVPLGLGLLAWVGPDDTTALHFAAYHYVVWMGFPIYTFLADRPGAVRGYVAWTALWTGLAFAVSPLTELVGMAGYLSLFVLTSMVHILTTPVLSDANP